ncbi:MAG: RNA polymerase sigma factor region1.1 domain-containing protein, partial [Gammaproteobacteria bacterium]
KLKMQKNLTSDIKKIVKKGKENGYILISELNEIIKDLKSADQQYIRDGMEELEIQVVKTPKDYDEYKYMTGEEAIAFLQGLSDGKTRAFVKDEENDK